MRVLTFSRHFPAGHPNAGHKTYFVEKVWKSIWDAHAGSNNPLYPWWELYDQAFPQWVNGFDINENIHQHQPKHHTIRGGSRWQVGDMASLRIWSDKPYRSKQIEFAQVEVKKVWSIEINVTQTSPVIQIENKLLTYEAGKELASNDGLSLTDFISWFNIHPKKKGASFTGQIICWSDAIDYSPLTSKVNA